MCASPAAWRAGAHHFSIPLPALSRLRRSRPRIAVRAARGRAACTDLLGWRCNSQCWMAVACSRRPPPAWLSRGCVGVCCRECVGWTGGRAFVLRVRGRLEFSMHARGSARSGPTLSTIGELSAPLATCLNFDWTIIGCEAATLRSGGGMRHGTSVTAGAVRWRASRWWGWRPAAGAPVEPQHYTHSRACGRTQGGHLAGPLKWTHHAPCSELPPVQAQ